MRTPLAVVLVLSLLPLPAGAQLTVPASTQRSKPETIDGYAEWHHGADLVVDGQRVTTTPTTKFKGKGLTTLERVPLGYEVKARGVRDAAGILVADVIEAKPNKLALFESDVLSGTKQLEDSWVTAGRMFEPSSDGTTTDIGRLVESGPDVDRVREIMRRLTPSYVDASALRVRIVDTKEWNAAAMGNGAIWVYRGLISELTDDELAVVLGHELAHYTHEHSRRNAKRAMWGQLAAAGVAGAVAATTDNKKVRDVALLASALSVTVWLSGYSRDLEDQADRVGLRYVHEAGYDVRAAPGLWDRFRTKYGEGDRLTSFFFGTHSRPSDRIKNVEREIARNYTRSTN